MIRLRDLSIRKKLMLLGVASSALALFLSSAGFVVNDVRTIRDAKLRELHSQAEMLGFNSSAVLTFHDAKAAGQLLESLRLQPEVESGCLYDARGERLAEYRRTAGVEAPERPASLAEGSRFTETGDLEIVHPVLDDGNEVGYVYLYANMNDLRRQLWNYVEIATIVALLSLGVSFLLSLQLQRTVSQPILTLAETARRISVDLDYSVRVSTSSRNELGTLFGAFNHMLDQIQAAQTAIQEANAAKSAFLANMSHEIRTPMTAILGYAEILSERARDEEIVEATSIIQRNGEHLLEIINGILDLSKIEAGRLEVERITCSPVHVVGDVISLMRVRAQAKQLTLDVEYQGAIPETVRTDPTRLRQILINLVGNAIKFTQTGGVRLAVGLLEAPDGAARMYLDVIDSGIGLTDRQAAKIFEAFSQADSSTTRRFGGTGLGLTISKRLAEMLGGDITLRSQVDVGSTFRVTIDPGPLDGVRRLESPSEAVRERNPVKGPVEMPSFRGRILLAEDGPDNQRLISLILRKAGAEVEVAENGRVACDKALAYRTEGGEPFDLILMDMQMPVMDGYQAVQYLRSADYAGPIIALTAHAMIADRQRCLDAGCEDYAPKPINRAEFLTQVARYSRTASEVVDRPGM